MLIGLIVLFCLNGALVFYMLYGRAFWRNGLRGFSIGWTAIVAIIFVVIEVRLFAVPLAALKYLFH